MTRKRIVIIDSNVERHFEKTDIEQSVLDNVDIDLVHISSALDLSSDYLEHVDAAIIWACIPAVQIDAEFINKLKNCKVITKAAVGYDNVDIDYAASVGIPVFNTPDYGTEEVADHAMALILALVRKLEAVNTHVKEGGWDWFSVKPIKRLRGAKLGIIGFGRTGSALARRASAFGFDTMFYDPYVVSGVEKIHAVHRCEDLDDLIEQADIITVHCDLNASSLHMLSSEQFSRMKPGVIIINTARGGVISNDALVEALDNNIVSCAGLDVVDNEPDFGADLRFHKKVLFTAHSAFYSVDSFVELRTKSAQITKNVLSGKQTRNLINSDIKLKSA